MTRVQASIVSISFFCAKFRRVGFSVPGLNTIRFGASLIISSYQFAWLLGPI